MKIIIYLICWLLIWWGYSGYVLFLYLSRKDRQIKKEIENYPDITMVVPCFNEENFIKKKIENLLDLNYPADKLRTIFVDGGSTDNTCEIIRYATQKRDNIRLVQSQQRGKIHQINSILPEIGTGFIVNTDVDAILEKDALIEIAREFQDDTVGVVGALTIPRNCSTEEGVYWLRNNQLRLLETSAYSSSIVIAPCYAFKKEVLNKFPEDVIADDIYTAFTAISKGFRVTYSKNAIAYETRAPQSNLEFIKHKQRKANAYLREIFRFVTYLPRFNRTWRVIYSTKFLQFTLIPLSIAIFPIAAILIFYENLSIFSISLIIMFLSVIISGKILSKTHVAYDVKSGMLVNIKTIIMSNLILIHNLFTYPFYKQTSSYDKIDGG